MWGTRVVLYTALGASLFALGWRISGELLLTAAFAVLGVVLMVVMLHGDVPN